MYRSAYRAFERTACRFLLACRTDRVPLLSRWLLPAWSPGLWATIMIAQCVLASMVAFVVQSEADYLMTGTIPAYAPSKLHMSAEARAEIDSLQYYVWASFRFPPRTKLGPV